MPGIVCPKCSGDPVLECICDGSYGGCRHCGGKHTWHCRCVTGCIEIPAYCGPCKDDFKLVVWKAHPIFSDIELTEMLNNHSLELGECVEGKCEDCEENG